MFIRYRQARNAFLGVTAAGAIGWLGYTVTGGSGPADGGDARALVDAPLGGEARAPAEGGRRAQSARRRILEVAGSPATPHSKRKDALGGGSRVKVNLYEETGDRRWDRAKIDFDRDGMWDEKWSFRGGRWEADGRPVTELISGEAPARPKTEAAKGASRSSGALPPDKLARLLLSERATAKKRKDVSAGQGAKVNLYDDDQDGHWDRAKVDANRDGTWDEKWTVKGGVVERKQLVNGKVFVWKAGVWVEKK